MQRRVIFFGGGYVGLLVTKHSVVISFEQVSKQYGLDEVTAVFLERRGDYQGAFDLLLNNLQLAMNQVCDM